MSYFVTSYRVYFVIKCLISKRVSSRFVYLFGFLALRQKISKFSVTVSSLDILVGILNLIKSIIPEHGLFLLAIILPSTMTHTITLLIISLCANDFAI